MSADKSVPEEGGRTWELNGARIGEKEEMGKYPIGVREVADVIGGDVKDAAVQKEEVSGGRGRDGGGAS